MPAMARKAGFLTKLNKVLPNACALVFSLVKPPAASSEKSTNPDNFAASGFIEATAFTIDCW